MFLVSTTRDEIQEWEYQLELTAQEELLMLLLVAQEELVLVLVLELVLALELVLVLELVLKLVLALELVLELVLALELEVVWKILHDHHHSLYRIHSSDQLSESLMHCEPRLW